MAPTVWYNVRDLDVGTALLPRHAALRGAPVRPGGELGDDRARRDGDRPGGGRAARGGGVAHVDVDDLKAEAERLREAGVEIGIVLELSGAMRLLDVFDPDGNRLQFAQELRA